MVLNPFVDSACEQLIIHIRIQRNLINIFIIYIYYGIKVGKAIVELSRQYSTLRLILKFRYKLLTILIIPNR